MYDADFLVADLECAAELSPLGLVVAAEDGIDFRGESGLFYYSGEDLGFQLTFGAARVEEEEYGVAGCVPCGRRGS